jgi:N-acetylglucosaminyldiphosphoundecaprenol N-acetyl-beta-D-mannosaminyltransferase
MTMFSIFSVAAQFQTSEQFRHNLEQALDTNAVCSIVTLNPEILLRAKKDSRFFEAIRLATHRVVDGFGIALVVWLKTAKRLHRITGRQVIAIICRYAQKRNLRVGCFGGTAGVAKKASLALARMYVGLEVFDVTEESFITIGHHGELPTEEAGRIQEYIRGHHIEVLLIGLGAPKQEYCMQTLQRACPSLRIAVGVGGLLDVFAGVIPEPPHWLQNIGCEWLWRVIHQPSRIFRIIHATLIFPFLAFPSLQVYDK